MKRTSRKPNKIPQIFRLRSDLVESLKKVSAKTNISKTRIIELALSEYMAVKK